MQEELFWNIRDVLEKSIDFKESPDKKDFPKDFIIPHRDGDAKCPICGEKIKRIKISSKSSYFCPRCQKE